jgi:hypothetical protein
MVVSEEFVRAHLAAHAAHARSGAADALVKGPIRELPSLVYAADLAPVRLSEQLPDRARRRIETAVEQIVADLEQPDRCWQLHGRPSRIEHDGGEAFHDPRSELRWLGFAGANLSARREALLELPFDERPGTRWGLEDIALAARWVRRGYALCWAEGARALHLSHARGRWKRDLDASEGYLEFLPIALASALVAYLKGDLSRQSLEAIAAAPTRRSRGRSDTGARP